ncbi:MAG: ribonuclease T2 family protein [Rhodomicrobium sp.]
MSKKPVCRQMSGILPLFLFAAALAIFAGPPHKALAQADRGGMPGDFDYYVLALSWSPTYCSGQGGSDGGSRSERDSQYGESRGYGGGGYGGRQYDDSRGYGRRDSGEQCSGTRPYAFVLHGLWPQYERKGWPESCQTGNRPWVPGETIERMLDIMPSRHLVIQEYKKHGVCSGLDPQQYFDAARKAYGSIRIPEQFQDPQAPLKVAPEDVQKAFLDGNRQLSADSLQVVCSRDLLREVRICLTKDLAPRPCSRNEQNRQLCSYSTVTMPPVRGGGTGPHGGPSFGRSE